MSDRHTSIIGTKVKSNGDGITIKKGSASIIGNVIDAKGTGIVIGEYPKETHTEKKWHERFVGSIGVALLIAVIGGLVVTFCAFKFGWTK